MIKYLQKKGTLVRPWNPQEGKDKRPRPPKGGFVGDDGLKDNERKRKMLLAVPPIPITEMPRRGKAPNPCDPYRMDIIYWMVFIVCIHFNIAKNLNVICLAYFL